MKYALQRIALGVAVVACVLVLTFSLIYLAPGGPALALRPGAALNLTPKALASLKAVYGLNKPYLAQLWSYLTHELTFRFGVSFQSGESVASLIISGLVVTVPLLAIAFVLSAVGGVALASLAASRPGTWIDRGTSGAAMFFAGTPAFVIGLALVFIFGVELQWLPVQGAGQGLAGRIQHLVLPSVTLALAGGAGVIKVTRVAVADVLRANYSTFTRSVGLPRWVVIWSAIRSSMIPIISILGANWVLSLSAVVLVESVFSLPGLGTVLLNAIQVEDIPVIQGVVFLIALVAVVTNLAIDLLYPVFDRRLRYGEQ